MRRYGSRAISMISLAVNHNETEGLRGFTVHTVDSSQTSHTPNLEDHKSIQKDGAVKTNVSVF